MKTKILTNNQSSFINQNSKVNIRDKKKLYDLNYIRESKDKLFSNLSTDNKSISTMRNKTNNETTNDVKKIVQLYINKSNLKESSSRNIKRIDKEDKTKSLNSNREDLKSFSSSDIRKIKMDKNLFRKQNTILSNKTNNSVKSSESNKYLIKVKDKKINSNDIKIFTKLNNEEETNLIYDNNLTIKSLSIHKDNSPKHINEKRGSLASNLDEIGFDMSTMMKSNKSSETLVTKRMSQRITADIIVEDLDNSYNVKIIQTNRSETKNNNSRKKERNIYRKSISSNNNVSDKICNLRHNSILKKNLARRKNTYSKFVGHLSELYSPKDLIKIKLKKKSEKLIKDMINSKKSNIINYNDRKAKLNWKSEFRKIIFANYVEKEIQFFVLKDLFKNNDKIKNLQKLNSTITNYLHSNHFNVHTQLINCIQSSKQQFMPDIDTKSNQVTLFNNFNGKSLQRSRYGTIRQNSYNPKYISEKEDLLTYNFLGIQNNEYINRYVTKDQPCDKKEEYLFLKNDKSNNSSTLLINKKDSDLSDNNMKNYIKKLKNKKSITNKIFNRIGIQDMVCEERQSRKSKKNEDQNVESNNYNLLRTEASAKIVFYRENKVRNSDDNIISKFFDNIKMDKTCNLTMSKENTVFRTMEIKSNMLKMINNPLEKLWFFIKDSNLNKFVRTLEKNKFLLEEKDHEGNTLLNLAVKSNSYEIVEYLLFIGSKINTQNKYLNSPLHYAFSFKNFRIANLLIAKKADQDLKNYKGNTPWQCLASSFNV